MQRIDACAGTRGRACSRSGPRGACASQAPPVGHMPQCGPSIGRRRAPQVGVVVGDPAAGAVHARAPCARRSRPGPAPCAVSGSIALGQVGRARRPVVHLGVDVDRVLAVPRRRHAVVPDALQVGRLRRRAASWRSAGSGRTGSRARRAGIVAVARTAATRSSVGDALSTVPRSSVDAVEEPLVVADVRGAQRRRCSCATRGSSAAATRAAGSPLTSS